MSVHAVPQIIAYSSSPKIMFEHFIVEFSKTFSEHVHIFYKWYDNLKGKKKPYIYSGTTTGFKFTSVLFSIPTEEIKCFIYLF